MKIRDKQQQQQQQRYRIPLQMNYPPNLVVFTFIFTLLLTTTISYSHGFKYIALPSTVAKVNVTLPETQQFNYNNVTLTDNAITDNDSEESHAKVVKTISSLLAESLNKSIGHFQYIQANRESIPLSERESALRLSMTTTSTTTIADNNDNGADPPKEPCPGKRRFDISLEGDNSDESKKVILDNSTSGSNGSIISVTLTSKTASDPLQDNVADKTASTVNPSNLITQVTGSSILNRNSKLEPVYDDDDTETETDDGDDVSNDSNAGDDMGKSDKKTSRKYFKPAITTVPSISPYPSPVYQPDGAVAKVAPMVQNHGKRERNNDTQFICLKVIDGKLTYPSAKLIYPQLKESSLVMPTIPKIPLSYASYKKYLNGTSDNKTQSISDDTSESSIDVNRAESKFTKQPSSSVRQAKHYIQRYYPTNLHSLNSIQKENISYTLASTLSFGDYEGPNNDTTSYVNNNQRRISSLSVNDTTITTSSTTTTTTTAPSMPDSVTSEPPVNSFTRADIDKVKYKPITYKTTVIIPKITTTTVSLSTSYPASSPVEPALLSTTTPIPLISPEMPGASNKITYESKGKKDSKVQLNRKRQDKVHNELIKSNMKEDKLMKKDVHMMNLGSSISSQLMTTSRVRFPDPSDARKSPQQSTTIDSAFDSFELSQPTEEPIIIPNSLIRPSFGLSSIVPTNSLNTNPFYHHQYNDLHQKPQHQHQHQHHHSLSQLSPSATANQHRLLPEVLSSSSLLPNDLTESPLMSLTSPTISSSYQGFASKIKSAINFSSKQQPKSYNTNQQHNPYSFVPSPNQAPFGYSAYDQSGLESAYKLNSHQTSSDLFYYDPRSNYKPDVNLMTPYLSNIQGASIRQPMSKHFHQYQSFASSSSPIAQRSPSQGIPFAPNHSQSQLHSNRQSLINSQTFYPVFQPVQSLSLNPHVFQQIHHYPGFHQHHQQQQRLKPLSASVHKLQPNYLNLIESGQSSSMAAVNREEVSRYGASSIGSSKSTDEKQLNKPSRKNKSKTGTSSRNRKRKNRRSNLISSSSTLSSSSQQTSSKNNANPCPSTDCQSLGGLLFNPSRSVKFELRDALS